MTKLHCTVCTGAMGAATSGDRASGDCGKREVKRRKWQNLPPRSRTSDREGCVTVYTCCNDKQQCIKYHITLSRD